MNVPVTLKNFQLISNSHSLIHVDLNQIIWINNRKKGYISLGGNKTFANPLSNKSLKILIYGLF